VALLGAAAVVVGAPAGPAEALTGKRAEAFAAAIAKGCTMGLKQEGAPYSDAAVSAYCRCSGTQTAEALKDEHMADFARAGGQATPELKALTGRVSATCGSRHLR
jgi:hypothetical protein